MLAYDRYQAIVQPLKYSSPNKLRWVAVHIASIYAFSYTLWLSPVIILSTLGPANDDCYFEKTPGMTILMIIVLAYPLLMMTFMYIRCIDGLRRHHSKLQPVTIRILSESDMAMHTAKQRSFLCGILNVNKWRSAAVKHITVTSPVSGMIEVR